MRCRSTDYPSSSPERVNLSMRRPTQRHRPSLRMLSICRASSMTYANSTEPHLDALAAGRRRSEVPRRQRRPHGLAQPELVEALRAPRMRPAEHRGLRGRRRRRGVASMPVLRAQPAAQRSPRAPAAGRRARTGADRERRDVAGRTWSRQSGTSRSASRTLSARSTIDTTMTDLRNERGMKHHRQANRSPRSGSNLRRCVGLTGFEPATPCPPDKCANQAALQPAIADDRSDRNASCAVWGCGASSSAERCVPARRLPWARFRYWGCRFRARRGWSGAI
jgi:hypothetical protein